MRSFLRDLAFQVRSARGDIFVAWLALLVFTVGGCAVARGEEAKSRAALALAKAMREREAASCHFDYDVAVAEARRLRKPLVLWIGVTCTEHPSLRRELNDAVHCHLASHNADRTSRVAIEDREGNEWYVRAENIGVETARKLRAKWR